MISSLFLSINWYNSEWHREVVRLQIMSEREGDPGVEVGNKVFMPCSICTKMNKRECNCRVIHSISLNVFLLSSLSFANVTPMHLYFSLLFLYLLLVHFHL